MIERLVDTWASSGTECVVLGLTDAPATALESINVLRRVPAEHAVETLDEARDTARRLLGGSVSG